MITSGSHYRSIYTQDSDFIFNFSLSNYSANNFYVGLSGTSTFGLRFVSGLIYDTQNFLVGAYNGEPIEFNSSKYNNRLEYSINGVPVLRNLFYTGVFDKIAVNIEGSGQADVSTYFYGQTPDISFGNIYSNSGISGSFYNNSPYNIEIFDIESNDYPGTWEFDTITSGYTESIFRITGASTFYNESSVNLTFKTNFGNISREFSVLSDYVDSGIVEDYYFASLSLASGNPRIVDTSQDFIYSVSYLTNSDYLSLYFDYTQGQSGDATVLRTRPFTGTYTGWLLANASGYCSGLLEVSNPTFVEAYELSPTNIQNVTFYKPTPLNYTNYATGSVTYSYNYYNDIINGIDRPLPSGNVVGGTYSVDVGGVFENRTVTGDSYKLLLNKSTYTGTRNITGNITATSMSGRYVFSSDSYQATGLFNSQKVLGTHYSNRLMTGYIYRGVACCFLPDDYVFKFTGHMPYPGGPHVYTGQIDSTYNCLFFKTVHNYSGSGQYVFSGLISGKVMVDQAKYYIGDGDFGVQEIPSQGFEKFNSLTHAMIQGMSAFDPEILPNFESISDPISYLYAGDNIPPSEYVATGSHIDFNGQSFLAHPAIKQNGQSYGYNIRKGTTTPTWQQIIWTDFTGQLPSPVTGFIQRGEYRHYIRTGIYSGFFLSHDQDEFTNIPQTQSQKTNINSLYTYEFNGEDPNLIVNKYINIVSPISVNQSISPSYTGYLQSGYFTPQIIDTGVSSGLFTGFFKEMTGVWNVSISDDIDGHYQDISVAPYIDGSSRYRIENIPVEGESEKYIKVSYTYPGFESATGDGGQISFTLNTSSGSSLIL